MCYGSEVCVGIYSIMWKTSKGAGCLVSRSVVVVAGAVFVNTSLAHTLFMIINCWLFMSVCKTKSHQM